MSHLDLDALDAAKRQMLSPGAAQGNGRGNGISFMASGSMLPEDFLQPLDMADVGDPSTQTRAGMGVPAVAVAAAAAPPQLQVGKISRQFWKAGNYESGKVSQKTVGCAMDRVRVHPKFLHSNATSHKWALGAIAELLDNALDEAVHGATFARIDVIPNPKTSDPMLVIEDDGGGMHPDALRHCMSLGFSAKSKMANTIGQYGNGFKTSTMRLGADVVVFSRFPGSSGFGPSQSIGMLSYTFLRETGQQDIIVPMVDYEIHAFGVKKFIRRTVEDWGKNMETIQQWSPYSTEAELLSQFSEMKGQGTRIVIYNLWEDDKGQLELDFETNRYDIQVRSNRDEKQIFMAERYPSARHYFSYRHSLRIYASILYLRLPPGFRMVLRGREIEHHNLIDDLMLTHVSSYRPQVSVDMQKDIGQAKAVVTIGFVKDAKEHIDVQGFNVYHKNRLIKPFWRLWNSSASSGRGIIGVLEANFVEPAHDKQGFERTIVLARLEARLIEMQKSYWSKYRHEVGYVNNSLKVSALGVEANPSLNHSQWNLSAVPQTYQAHRNPCAPLPNGSLPLHLLGPHQTPFSGISTHQLQVETTHVHTDPNHYSAQGPIDDAAVHTWMARFPQAEQTLEKPVVNGLTSHEQNQANLGNKNPVLANRSVEDLGWTVSKKVTAATANGDIVVVDPGAAIAHEEKVIEARGESGVESKERESGEDTRQVGSLPNCKELEVRIVDVDFEIQSLQERLDEVIAERDRVRQQLVEERIKGEARQKDLQMKVDQTWAKVKELEARNASLRLVHSKEEC